MAKTTLADVEDKVRDLIVAQSAYEDIPGIQKFDRVVNEVVEWLDDRAKWGFAGPLERVLEGADGFAFRWIARVVVQLAYVRLKNSGRI